MRSAMRTLEKRWEMSTTVRPWPSSRKRWNTSNSERASSAAVGHADAGEAVGDEHHGAPLAELAEALEHLELGARVERRGRLVEDKHVGAAHIGAGDRDLLPFAAGEVDAVAEAAADHLVVAL